MTAKTTAKRVSAALVCLLMLLSIATLMIGKVKAAESRPTFEQYKASYYIKYSPYSWYKSNEFNLPYRTVVETNRNSPAFLGLVSAWEIATFQLSDVDDDLEKKIAFYEAFLYDILYNGEKKDNICDQYEKGMKGLNASALSNFTINPCLHSVGIYDIISTRR